MNRWFCGIDPGQTGGIGVVDSAGLYVAAHRWDKSDPVRLYNILLLLRENLGKAYLEMINVHPGEGVGHVTRNQSLVANWGIWQGWLMAAGIPYTLVHPATWQAAAGLHHWQARRKVNPASPSPIAMARQWWPTAPLQAQADDGRAVGLILADLARRDHLAGIDRAAMQAHAQAKRKAKRQKARAAKKAHPPPPDPWDWPDAPIAAPPPSQERLI